MRTETKVTQIGWDSHRKFSKVTARDASHRVVWRQRVDHKDRKAMQEKLGTWPAGTPVILESTFGWGWISDELQAAKLEPHLANSRKVAGWRDARGLAKSDRVDADLLSELWSEPSRWWEVWLAPPEVRDQREWLRYRMSLVAIQTGLKNRIHAILHRHGIVSEHSDLFGIAGRRLLNMLAGPGDITLRESARAMLKGYLQLLDHVRRQIVRITREFRRQLVRRPEGQRLVTLPGIGQILAYTIVAEVGQIERFASGRNLAAYSLLVPRGWDSAQEGDAEPPKGRHVGHAGRRTLKWAWIEAAHGAVKRGGRFREIFDSRTNGGTRDRNRGYIAVARELCRVSYAMWTKETDYREDRPARPGATILGTELSSGKGPARAPYGRCRRKRQLQTSL